MGIVSTIFLVLLCLALIIVYEVFFKAKIKWKWLQITIWVVLVVVVGPLAFHFITSIGTKEQQKDEEDFRRQVLSALEQQKVSSTNELRELLKLKYRSFFQSTEEEAKKWVENFLESLPEKKRAVEMLSEKGEELASSLRLKWEPVFQFALNNFDARINELIRKHEISEFIKEEASLILVDDYSVGKYRIRKAVFNNGNSITVWLYYGIIEKGILIKYPSFAFKTKIGSHTPESVFIISFPQDTYEFNVGHPVKHREVLDDLTIKSDPLLNDKFRNMIIRGINYTIELVYLSKS